MDADLQDDINAVDEMLERYYEGNQVVYGVRSARKTDTFFKKFTAEGFYKFMKVMGADVVYNHADYRLMSRRVLQELSGYKEVNLFLRGMIPLIGFKSCNVYYERAERFAGESKYPLKKMIAFAVNGITSFSTKPLKLITYLGFIMFAVSITAFIWAVVAKSRRIFRTRLVKHYGFNMADRRASAFMSRNNRRICRKNICGSKTASEIYSFGFPE